MCTNLRGHGPRLHNAMENFRRITCGFCGARAASAPDRAVEYPGDSPAPLARRNRQEPDRRAFGTRGLCNASTKEIPAPGRNSGMN